MPGLVDLLGNEDADIVARAVTVNGYPTACRAVGDRQRPHLGRNVFADWQDK